MTLPLGVKPQCREAAGAGCWTTCDPRRPAQNTPGGRLDRKHMLPADRWLARHHIMKINRDR